MRGDAGARGVSEPNSAPLLGTGLAELAAARRAGSGHQKMTAMATPVRSGGFAVEESLALGERGFPEATGA